ncbi:hypothetical protein [Streptacidiphilus sp. PAMC 29251]
MSDGPEHPRKLLGRLTLTSIAMIVVGLCTFAALMVFTVPGHTRVTLALKSRGVQTRATVTECAQALHDENGAELPVACTVRFTPPGGSPVESPLAFSTHRVATGHTVLVVYDPRDTGTVALPSDLGYWTTVVRNAGDVLLLLISAAMVPLGLAGLALRRFLGPS